MRATTCRATRLDGMSRLSKDTRRGTLSHAAAEKDVLGADVVVVVCSGAWSVRASPARERPPAGPVCEALEIPLSSCGRGPKVLGVLVTLEQSPNGLTAIMGVIGTVRDRMLDRSSCGQTSQRARSLIPAARRACSRGEVVEPGRSCRRGTSRMRPRGRLYALRPGVARMHARSRSRSRPRRLLEQLHREVDHAVPPSPRASLGSLAARTPTTPLMSCLDSKSRHQVPGRARRCSRSAPAPWRARSTVSCWDTAA